MSLFKLAAKLLVLFCVFFSASPLLADSYQLNPANSKISFQFYHYLSDKEKISGSFPQFELDIALDDSQEIEFLAINIFTKTVRSKNNATNSLLKEKKFFDTETYNKITFRSESVENLSKVSWVTGELNIKDIYKKVILKLHKRKTTSTRSFEESYSFSGKLLLNPKDFELNKKNMQTTGQENTKQITSENLLELFFKIEVFRPF